jgi:NADPH:quinone reductase
MKAAVYYEDGGPDVLRYEDVPDPVCDSHGVVIDVKAISIDGGDVLSRAAGVVINKPLIVGYQCAGVVAEVGAEVTTRKVGQRVTCIDFLGSHAERRAVPARSTWLVPNAVSAEQAACVPIPFGTAHDCLFEFGRLQDGEHVLVQGGAGGVGLAAVQLAKRAGAIVYATASSDEKLEHAREYGVDHPINYRERDLVATIKELTSGRGVDLVVDPVGGGVLQQSLACTGHRGRVMSCSNASRGKQLDIRGMSGKNQSLTCVRFGAERCGRGEERVQRLVTELLEDVAFGTLKVAIDKCFSLSEAAAAYAYIESCSPVGRTLLIP